MEDTLSIDMTVSEMYTVLDALQAQRQTMVDELQGVRSALETLRRLQPTSDGIQALSAEADVLGVETERLRGVINRLVRTLIDYRRGPDAD